LLLPDVRLSQALEDLRLSLLQLAGFTIFFVDDLNFLANCFVLLFFSFDPFFNSNFFGVDPYSVVNGADLLTTWLELLHLFLLHLSVFAEHLVNFFFNQLSLVFFQFHHLTNLYLWRGLLVVVGESQLIVAGCVSNHSIVQRLVSLFHCILLGFLLLVSDTCWFWLLRFILSPTFQDLFYLLLSVFDNAIGLFLFQLEQLDARV
jgi:hypothetical protein